MASRLPGIVIPAYQPDSGLVGLVESLLRDDYPFVVVVDDGSDAAHQPIFDRLAQLPRVEVLAHFVNLGKGAALKTGFNHALVHHPDLLGVVTVDADGQHLRADVHPVAEALVEHPDHLCLGVRGLQGRVPWRSRIGNTSTRWVLRLVVGMNLRDTQTGLRGIPRELMAELLALRTARYEFELEMLIRARRQKLPVLQIPIATVYHDDNAGSHFNPLRDSLRIYMVFARFLASAALTALLDIATFMVSHLLGASLLGSFALGRVIAGSFNFMVNKHLVFKARQSYAREATRYVALVFLLMAVSYQLTLALIDRFGLPALGAKLCAEGFLLLVSFAAQRIYVFSSGMEGSVGDGLPEQDPARTDWDAYYEAPGGFTGLTRRITGRKLLRCLRLYRGPIRDARLLEFGGGNSCFFQTIVSRLEPGHYAIADNNPTGLEMFGRRFGGNEDVSIHQLDVLDPRVWEDRADVCFSVGLIEHFDPERTARAIRAHFEATRPGGLVIIFFPTPTRLYRMVRSVSEALGLWVFHDERPLEIAEVLGEMERHGRVVFQGINWWIGLTQAMVAVEADEAR